MSDEKRYIPAQSQDPIVEVRPDLFLVRGSADVAPHLPISRNMVVIRDSGELTLIGPVRMPPDSEAQLESLGKVARILRIGVHGMDDAYTVERFGCELMCLKGTEAYHDMPPVSGTFDESSSLPFANARAIRFRGTSISEAAILWERDGGVLITSDALQHYVDWRFFSWPSVLVHKIMGFGAGTIVGPMWHRFLVANETEARKTFEMLLDLPFTHALGLHGGFVEDNAKAAIRAAISREFDEGPAMPDWFYRLTEKGLRKKLAKFTTWN